MKKLILMGFAVLFLSCDKQEKRYTQQSPEIDTYKKVIADYENQNWEDMATHYADSAKILNNVTMENAQSIGEVIATNKEDAKLFSGWNYDPESTEYEMIVNDRGETWVNFWGRWRGTLKANNEAYVIPTHITARFLNGKIVREDGYWDISKIVADLQKLQETQKDSVGTEPKIE